MRDKWDIPKKQSEHEDKLFREVVTDIAEGIMNAQRRLVKKYPTASEGLPVLMRGIAKAVASVITSLVTVENILPLSDVVAENMKFSTKEIHDLLRKKGMRHVSELEQFVGDDAVKGMDIVKMKVDEKSE